MTETDLKTLVARILKVPPENLIDNSSPDTIPDWDSIKAMNIVLALEDRLGIELTDEQISSMLTYKLIRTVVEEATGQTLSAGHV